MSGARTLHEGDCREILARRIAAEADLFDACVTDPPYHFESIVKRYGSAAAAPARSRAFARQSAGFHGLTWDGGDVTFDPDTWRLVFETLKPGAHLLAFSAARYCHRVATAIEAAGFEIRDQIYWHYSSGMPKSHNVGNDIDKLAGAPPRSTVSDGGPYKARTIAGEPWEQWGTALKPATEPIIFARKPISEKSVAENVLKWGTGGIFAGDTANGGRWPANLAHDGSPAISENLGDAARFFYSPKASRLDRAGSDHPTVKPTELMRWLCRMVTPPGGTILDPFAGTGSTGVAALLDGFSAELIELSPDYCADIRLKLERFAGAAGESRLREARLQSDQVKREAAAGSGTPLFEGGA